MALLLTICFTNFYLTRSLFRHISEPLDELVAGVERIQRGDLDSPLAYAGSDEFKAACDAVDLMSAKLKAALEAEQRRTQSRKELIAGMSHDLKSPLTSIRAYSEAIRDGVAASPEMRQRYIETVCRRELEIEEMVNRLFEFSKLDLSELPLDMQALDAAAEISAVTADYADRADIDMRVPSGCTVYADRSQLRRIAVLFIILAVVTAVAIPLSLSRQISDAAALRQQYAAAEASGSDIAESSGEGHERERHHDEEEIWKSKITPLTAANYAVIGGLSVLWAVLVLAYWLTVAAWLCKSAVNEGMNRSLWPILGLFFNVFAVMAFCIVRDRPQKLNKA